MSNGLNHRTVAEIRTKVTENLSRLTHTVKDKDMVSAWKSDLNKALRAFTVRAVVLTWLSPQLFRNTLSLIFSCDGDRCGQSRQNCEEPVVIQAPLRVAWVVGSTGGDALITCHSACSLSTLERI